MIVSLICFIFIILSFIIDQSQKTDAIQQSCLVPLPKLRNKLKHDVENVEVLGSG